MTDLLFPDISEYQDHANLAGIRSMTGAIADRIAYGATPDKEDQLNRIGNIRSQKFDAVIYYIFMRPSNRVSVTAQFNAVKQQLPYLQPGEAVCVDWETDPYPTAQVPAASDREALLAQLDSYYKQMTLLYGSASSLNGYISQRGLWIASYGVNTEPAQTHILWQYTNGHYTSAGHTPVNWPGAGCCDTSIFHGTSQQLAAIITGKKGPTGMTLNKPIAGMIVTKSGNGYWLYAQDGGLFAFGDATPFTDPLPGMPLSGPVVGGALTPTGEGLWLVGSDGGIFRFGDAADHGNIPGLAA